MPKKVFTNLVAFVIIAIIIIIALNPYSKACKLGTKFSWTGFEITFSTNEKSTPSR